MIGQRGLGRGARYFRAKRGVPRRFVRARRIRRRRYVPRTLGPLAQTESKYFDQEASATAINEGTAWVTGHDIFKGTIAIPQEGSDINARVGRRIEVYKIAIRGVINHSALQEQPDAVEPPAYRLILYQDMQTNGTVTNASALMQNSTAGTIKVLFNTMQNPANFGRFRVLKDIILPPPKTVFISDHANATNSTGSISAEDIPFKCTYKFKKPVVVRFNATNGGTIADVVDNSFYFAIAKSNTIFVSTVSARTRCYYKDK